MVRVMKLSVSVPDDLWSSAQAAAAEVGDSPSAVVQVALNRLVNGSGAGPGYAHRPAGAAAVLAEVQEQLLLGARADYSAGYTAAQSGFEHLTWPILSFFARHDFKLRPAFAALVEDIGYEDSPVAGAEELLYGVYGEAVGADIWDSSDPDQVEFRSTAYLDGFRDALRDAYAVVARGSTPPRPSELDPSVAPGDEQASAP